jgi:FeS assembly SUF system regulator
MLRLSKLGDYGTVIMAHIARDPGRRYSAAEIAAGIAVSQPTVSKLLKILARAGLLVSHRGARGGYSLAQAPERISIAQIIDAVEGRVAMTECNVTAGLCAQEPGCMGRSAWLRINEAVRGVLEGVRLAEFVQPASIPVRMVARRPQVHPGLEPPA